MSIPSWLLKSRSPSHQKYIQRTLQQRENTRAYIRFLHLKRLDLPDGIPRQIFDYYSVAVGCHPNNANKNRYADVIPYDRTRIVVRSANGTERYLNANFCLEQQGGKWWIAAQAPLPQTAHAFLSLIRQPIATPLATAPSPRSLQPTRVRTVVQLTMSVEGGRRKAHSYFPSHIGPSHAIVHNAEPDCSGAALRVTLVESVEIADACCVKSTVSISLDGDQEADPITFQHLLYTAWPDQGVPESKDQKSLMAFLHLVESTNRQADDTDPPMIVGCSAGIGRTGTFIAISSLLRSQGFLPATASPSQISLSSPLGPLPTAFNEDLIGREVDSLREQRSGMVQQTSQLELIYTLLEAAFMSSNLRSV